MYKESKVLSSLRSPDVCPTRRLVSSRSQISASTLRTPIARAVLSGTSLSSGYSKKVSKENNEEQSTPHTVIVRVHDHGTDACGGKNEKGGKLSC